MENALICCWRVSHKAANRHVSLCSSGRVQSELKVRVWRVALALVR